MVSASTYYFNSSPEQEGDAEVGFGLQIAYMNHAGSLAFGSLLISIIQFIKYVFVYLAETAAKKAGQENNAAVACAIGCAKCILKCLEEICDYINKTAYAFMAISGQNFCSSAYSGFLLNIKHGMKFYWANLLADVFIFLGKIAIVAANCFSLFFIMKYITKDVDEVSSIWGPIAIVGIETYMAASIFLGLFDESVLALLHCLCVDVDLNGEPKFGPPTFHDSVAKIPSSAQKNDQYNKVNEMA
uniref:Choline transporter-like protein n=1 Tax=Strombidium rassoulzadegani TaxID=1082188 RepID=A0A7S3FS90_9SPIT|mmetsp:Transcript_13183/g.22352  ORF Transcript_13183/g.22352 Transcript_13183/m.22352 type:complete len:244 (+) Transcript_13183:1262-1993(+)